MYLGSQLNQLMQFSLRPISFLIKFGIIRIKRELLQSLWWKQKLCFYKIMYLFAIVFISPQVEYLTTVQQGDRNHWRNREWNADAKFFVLSMQHIPKRVFIFCQKVKQWKLFDVNLRHFLCLCVRAYCTVLVHKFLTPIPYKIWKFRGKIWWIICF